ncbi:MAG TPA: CHASE2 domain-containing protein [Cyclobacteriaceae bacterium]
MFKKFWLDTILATIFIFGLMGLFSSVTAFKIFELFDPIGDALADVRITDVVFSQLREDPVAEEDIVLVNIGIEPRAGIATMLQIINAYNPKVIGVDTFFSIPKDSLGDALLEEALAQIENLVLVTKLELYNEETEQFDSLLHSLPRFSRHADAEAFANLITGAQQQDQLKTCRTFTPKEIAKDEYQVAFGVKLAEYLSQKKVDKFINRNNDIETINFRGNVLDYGATNFGNKYFALDVDDVYSENFLPDIIEDKIIIFCFLGNYIGDQLSTEDKFITPLNKVYAGRTKPDMFGGVIHANIVSMILNEDYVDRMDEVTAVIVAIIFCFLNVVLFSVIYKRIPKWYDGVTKLFQVFELIGLSILIVYFFHWFSYELNLTLALAAIALSGDSLEVYYGVVKNLTSKQGRKELLKINKL